MAEWPLRGRLLWYELLTTDVDAAEKFYTTVVGWTATPFADASSRYDLWMRGDGTSTGGVMPIPEGMNFPPHWVMYVGVDKLDDAVAQIERLGGKALSPVIDLPAIGRMRTMLDPQGGMFSIYEPVSPPTVAEGEAPIGGVAWHELHTTDAEAALAFYRDVFGWQTPEPYDMGPMGKYHMFERVVPLGGMMTKSPEMAQLPTAWGLYFRVPDVHEAAERVKANGGTVMMGPMEVPGGDWVVMCMDPQGAAFNLHHKK